MHTENGSGAGKDRRRIHGTGALLNRAVVGAERRRAADDSGGGMPRLSLERSPARPRAGSGETARAVGLGIHALQR
jgi:hypothetical protein